MESGDQDAPTQKRLRLDSVNPVYNGLPPPPPQSQPARHPAHPTSVQASSPPARHYPPHSLPPPTHHYPPAGQAHYAGPQPSPSLPPSDIRAYSDPRNIPSPRLRTHGLAGPHVTLSTRNIPQDSISTYRPPTTPQASSAAPDSQSSRSTSVDAKAGMEHGGHQAPWPMNVEHRHNSNGTNGYSPAMSPPNHNEPPFHPPALPPGQHYAQPANAYASSPYMSQYASQQQVRRKQVRATQACNHCRSRKQKCDEARPCQFCRENNFDCQYKDVPPPKQDRSMMQLQDGINHISDTLNSFIEGINAWKQSVESRLAQPSAAGPTVPISNHPSPNHVFGFRGSMSEQSGSGMPTPVQGRAQLRRVSSMKTESPIVPQSRISPVRAHTSTPIKQEGVFAAPQPPATPAESVATENMQLVGGAFRARTGLQSDHTTPAHQLLDEWPAMKNFYSGIQPVKEMVANGVIDYPMQLEQERGLIRVWGVGEGRDLNDGTQGSSPSISSPESINESAAPSPSPNNEGIWGAPPVDHSSPSTMSGGTPRDYQGTEGSVIFEGPGGLGIDGKPVFHSKVLNRLLGSYLHHVHSMHPFLNPNKLGKMIKEFSETYSPDLRPPNVLSPGIPANYLNPGVKRKRSGSTFTDHFLSSKEKGNTIERSLRNAIILLVLALGKVCEWRRPLPAPYNDRNPLSRGDWGYPQESPRSSNDSFGEDSDGRLRNIDLLPGMAYYAYASDILGNQQGGNTVAHAQAHLLAALYQGQFARVLESWSWINNACRICLVLVKADFSKISRDALFSTISNPPADPPDPDTPAAKEAIREAAKEEYRLNLVKCVYWTCLQLESDILAEMSSLPATEISKYQDKIAYPTGVYGSFEDVQDSDTDRNHSATNPEANITMWIYSSQIHLRVILNEAHNTLYGKSGNKNLENLREVAGAARVHADVLKRWRDLLPPVLSWDDNAIPATDMNIARLRAKYYGGRYMILRPFLYISVHGLALPPRAPIASSSQNSSPAAPADSFASSNGTNTFRDIMELSPDQDEILDIAFHCIDSAIQSTIAFDRTGADPDAPYVDYSSIRKGRPILTNIFGTLHAQFGNMIVLAAVLESQLQPRIQEKTKLNRQNLIRLFRRTIDILKEVAPNSPILAMDLRILEKVKTQLRLE
ncbi:hypothetical protein BDV95DRAFT_6112 [Massariosphaeria phaeospora]|uniref:Zn(2)-C6 fungal-type domain-containing protein n=1 Tax=Massariosphaeria phaeospora TaxID=100035 RepID=A0A7C8MHV5_9PLEO|nr:hypothetical protein BDV95DRAFT_6112 [Massariosphaeria phaeospora]